MPFGSGNCRLIPLERTSVEADQMRALRYLKAVVPALRDWFGEMKEESIGLSGGHHQQAGQLPAL